MITATVRSPIISYENIQYKMGKDVCLLWCTRLQCEEKKYLWNKTTHAQCWPTNVTVVMAIRLFVHWSICFAQNMVVVWRAINIVVNQMLPRGWQNLLYKHKMHDFYVRTPAIVRQWRLTQRMTVTTQNTDSYRLARICQHPRFA